MPLPVRAAADRGRQQRLAATVRQLPADPALRSEYGRAGRRRVLERFTWARVAAATEESSQSVVAARVPMAATP
ncbi:glycosyltransferase family protein [Streptomyces exfoliatus]|uniref:glycosyltransferase family protein n=1 Tax=Streptomyces exfoliatus TaxID=1905 RepID=UPI000567EDA7|nr:glycosyltransferase [Streptomyces exfoliatus]